MKPCEIIIIDDSDADRFVFSTSMGDIAKDLKVSEAHGVSDGIDMVRQVVSARRRFIALVDVRLGDGLGYDLLDAVMEDRQVPGGAVFMWSGSVLPKDVSEAYKRGVAGYFEKSGDLDGIKRIATTLVDFASSIEFPPVNA